MRRRGRAWILPLALLAGCTEQSTEHPAAEFGGTLVISTTAEPDQLFPPLPGNLQSRQVTELVYDYLAQPGTAMNVVGDAGFIPQLARSWTWSSDSLQIAFHLAPDARWHDGVPVRASDVRFTRDLYTSRELGQPLNETLADLDSVSTPDSATAVFWFRRRSPEQFYRASSLMLILPKHLLSRIPRDSLGAVASGMRPVGSGRFRYFRAEPGSSVELVADTLNYRGRPHLDRVIWSVAPDFQGALTRVLGGDADVFDALHAENVSAVARRPDLRVVTLPGTDYVFMQLNLRDPADRSRPHPIFGERETRRALTMALDREAMVRNVFDTLADVPVGPAVRAMPTTSRSLRPIPYDTVRAAALFDSLGWMRSADGGTRARHGRRLAFTLLVPTSSAARVKMSVLIQSQLARAGVVVKIEKMDAAAFAARQEARDFDAELGAWHLSPSPSSVQEVWTTSAARRKDGRNYGAYENAQFDATVDSAISARDSKSASLFFSRAYQMITDDAPAIWLYEPRTVIALHRRFQVTGMRPDAWWAGVGDWRVAGSARIARDRPQSPGKDAPGSGP